MVVSGRGTQQVGEAALDLGPGDTCFIPRNTPHRITGTSEEGLVIPGPWVGRRASSRRDTSRSLTSQPRKDAP